MEMKDIYYIYVCLKSCSCKRNFTGLFKNLATSGSIISVERSREEAVVFEVFIPWSSARNVTPSYAIMSGGVQISDGQHSPEGEG